MTTIRIFVSSVQGEFARERIALRDYVHDDPLLRRIFKVFLFEDVPASDRRPDELYLDEVERCDIYVGLFGRGYGTEDGAGYSPTEREFDRATAKGAHRLIFLRNVDEDAVHPKMQTLIGKAQAGLVRKRFNTWEELKTGVYAALVECLDSKELLRQGPFDAAPCVEATLDDLDVERMRWFIRRARQARGFPLADDISPTAFLEHLDLMDKGRPTNAAVLLFGKRPQRFLISSEVKCAHFHGTEVAKPIPSYQVYKGTVFELVDQAVDFVLSKISRSVGTRANGVRAERTYEIPMEVVTEAIVNAVAHRDYASNGSVQVMLFADRLEIWNPGRLPPTLTFEKLRSPHNSVPANLLLAHPMYLTEYIEQMGTGTLDMIRRCRETGLPEPDFAVRDVFVATIWRAQSVTAHGGSVHPKQTEWEVEGPGRLAPQDAAMLRACAAQPVASGILLSVAGYSRRAGSFTKRLGQLLQRGLLERTVPNKPRSPEQRYRLTEKGTAALEARLGAWALQRANRGEAMGQVRGQEPGHAEGQVKGQARGHAVGQDGGQARTNVPKLVDIKDNFHDDPPVHTTGQGRGQARGHAVGEAAGHAEQELFLSAEDITMLRACIAGGVSGKELLAAAGYPQRSGAFGRRVGRLLNEELLEMTMPHKPRSPLQRYRLTKKGKDALEKLVRRGTET